MCMHVLSNGSNSAPCSYQCNIRPKMTTCVSTTLICTMLHICTYDITLHYVMLCYDYYVMPCHPTLLYLYIIMLMVCYAML